MNQIIDQIRSLLEQSEHILLTTHTNPDGDAIGSLLALGLALLKSNRNATLYNESPIPAVYRFLPSVERITRRPPRRRRVDAAVVLDCGDLSRTGEIELLLRSLPAVVNIDHHATNTGFGHLRMVDERACATAEMVHRLITAMGIDIDADMATAIYTGIFTDTGSFRFANTSRASFEICNRMVALGADPYKVAKHVYGTYSLGRIKLLNRALDSIEISDNGKLSLMTLTRDMFHETGTHAEDVDGMINYARRIRNVKVAVLIHEIEKSAHGGNGWMGRPNGCHRYHVSLRSDGTVDVAGIAAAFGGGGHASAAGFNTDSGIAELKNGMLDLADRL